MKLLNKIIKYIPKNIRGHIIRNKIKLDYNENRNYKIKIAENLDELCQAFQVLHDSYVEKKYMNPHPSGMRFTPYHFLPTSTTFIIKENNEVIGTMTVIKEASLGIPSDSIYDLEFLRQENYQIGEISSLAISSKYRHKNGSRFFSLMKYMWHYVTDYMKLDVLIVSVNPEQMFLYDDILLFNEIKLNVKKYAFVNGADTIGRYAIIKELPPIFKKIYARKPKINNLYQYFENYIDNSLQFPKRSYYKTMDPILNKKNMTFLIQNNPEILSILPLEKKIKFLMQYLNTSYLLLIRKFLKLEFELHFYYTRKHYRFQTHLIGQISNSNSNSTRIKPKIQLLEILEVSNNGLAISIKNSEVRNYFTENQFPIAIKIQISQNNWSFLTIEQNNSKTLNPIKYGFKILKSDPKWLKYISYLQDDLNKENLSDTTSQLATLHNENVPFKKCG